MAKMANGGFLCFAIEKIRDLIEEPPGEIRAEMQWRVEFPWYKKVTAAK
jgi:hypothetical protein